VSRFEENRESKHECNNERNDNEEEENEAQNEEYEHPDRRSLAHLVSFDPPPVVLREELHPAGIIVSFIVHTLVQLHHGWLVEPDHQHVCHVPAMLDIGRDRVFHRVLDVQLQDHADDHCLHGVWHADYELVRVVHLNPTAHVEYEKDEETVCFGPSGGLEFGMRKSLIRALVP